MILFAIGDHVAMLVAIEFVQHGSVVSGEPLCFSDHSAEEGRCVDGLLHAEQRALDEVV